MKDKFILEKIKTLERELADQRPFGNAQYINNLIDRACLHRLSIAESVFPATLNLKQSLDCLSNSLRHHILRDTLLRIGIDQAMLYAINLPTRYPLDEIIALLSRAESLLKYPHTTTILDSLHPLSTKLGTNPSSPLIWKPSTDLISQNMEELVHEMVADAHIDSVSQEQIKILKLAMTLLETLLPQLTDSVINHVTSIIIISERQTPGLGHRGFGSGTNRSLPGVIVISASEIKSPWEAAEILLHEALHLKFIDLEFTHSMNPNASEEDEEWTIMPPWLEQSVNNDGWPPIRAMTAAHVYMGMSLLFHRAQLLARHPNALNSDRPIEFPITLQDAPFRAQFLLTSLSEHIEDLGLAGQYFIQWLQELMELLPSTSVQTDAG